ncbi:hypothetical protein CLU79DRAFT_839686 [Phycomyces nitens]|nr:hypothetical protein CLU79DRAFT_839686 [Phycomyces nitens]
MFSGNDSRMKRLLASRHKYKESLNVILPKASSFTCWFSPEHESPKHLSAKDCPIPCRTPSPTIDLSEKSPEPKDQTASIPERHTSRFYHQNPDVQARLERVSQSEQMILLSKHLRKQRDIKPASIQNLDERISSTLFIVNTIVKKYKGSSTLSPSVQVTPE